MSNIKDKLKYFIGIDDYEEEEEVYEEVENIEDDLYVPAKSKVRTRKFNNNVVNIHNNTSNMKIVVHEPLSYDEAPSIVDDLKQKKAVVVNFEQLDGEIKRQIFDFINGGLYAVEGNIQKINKDVFILAPSNVEIDGITKELNNRGIFPW